MDAAINKDNSSGIQHPLDRKRRLNRLRQQAWRNRKRSAAAGYAEANTFNADHQWEGFGLLVVRDESHLERIGVSSLIENFPNCYQQDQIIRTYYNSSLAGDWEKPVADRLIPPLLPYTTCSALGRPTPTITFPLSPDHRLITLVQYNVVRALIFNMSILSLLGSLPLECSRSFGVTDLGIIPSERIPVDLQPTPLQNSTPHPFWVRLIPFPPMRDNLIISAGNYDANDFCYDLGQALYEGFDDVERRGFVVWGEPWRASGWEMTEGFVKKWNFVLRGCPDAIESTNRWRSIRGEDRLVVET